MQGYNIADKIKYIRQYFGLGKTEFGKKLGFTFVHVDELENSQVDYTDDKYRNRLIDKICTTLNVAPDYFDDMVDDDKLDQYIAKLDYDHSDGLTTGERIKNNRLAGNMTQSELADASSTARSLVSSLESGKMRLSDKAAEKLAASLGVGKEYLLTGDLRYKDYPADKEMMNWLWEHPDERKVIWEKMKK